MVGKEWKRIVAFECPVGACADVAELEYVSALHQTTKTEIRRDGSIKAVDIINFLRSRYGIDITEVEVRRTILQGLGGGDDEEECIDMTEIVTILLIPYLLKASFVYLPHLKKDEFLDDSNLGKKERRNRRELQDSLRANNDDHDAVKDVLKMILGDVTGSTTPKKLDKDLIMQMFSFYGEKELLEDENIIEEMIMAATGEGGEGGDDSGVMLDATSFARALTSDVTVYDVNSELSLTTNDYDVFHKCGGVLEALLSDSYIKRESLDETITVGTVRTGSAFDFIRDTQGSQYYVAALWAWFLSTYLAYFYHAHTHITLPCNNFGCRLAEQLIQWITLFLAMSILGALQIGVALIGNNINSSSIVMCATAILFTAIFTIIPFLVDMNLIIASTVKYKDGISRMYYWIQFLLGCFILLLQLHRLFVLLVPDSFLRTHKWIQTRFGYDNIRQEALLKQATSRKINGLVSKALDVHKMNEQASENAKTFQGRALLNYMKYGEKSETRGGLLWTFKGMFSGEMYSDQGIWISGRIFSSTMSLFIIIVIITVIAIIHLNELIAEYQFNMAPLQVVMSLLNYYTGEEDSPITVEDDDPNTDDIFSSATDVVTEAYTTLSEYCNNSALNLTTAFMDLFNVPKQFDFNATLFNVTEEVDINVTKFYKMMGMVNMADTFSISFCKEMNKAMGPIQNLQQKVNAAVDFIYTTLVSSEQNRAVIIAAIIGGVVAIISAVFTAMVYIPSTVSTVMKLRSGIIPTFRDPNFQQYRSSLDYVTYVLGSMVWGVLYSAFLMAVLTFGLVFLFLSPTTRSAAVKVAISLLALAITLGLKKIVLFYFRRNTAEAFYRKNPFWFNFWGLLLECWAIGTSVGFMLSRAAKLLVLTILFIGRIDTPIIGSGIGPLGQVLDSSPAYFLKDILAHEAHRHPYIERLGVMYLMKLRHGAKFAKTSGTCWRMLFVFALMPWLRKYRVMARPSLQDGDKNEHLDEYAVIYNVTSEIPRKHTEDMTSSVSKIEPSGVEMTRMGTDCID
jgi:hypothetical protein